MTLHATSADELADGFRNHTLCIPFEKLELSGPDSKFTIRGVLVQDDGELRLRYMPIQSDGSDVPNAPTKRLVRASEWWKAEGTTWDGAPLTLTGLEPPWASSETTNSWGTRIRFSSRVQVILVHRADHFTEDDLKIAHGEDEAALIIEKRKSHSSVHAVARIANARQKFVNTPTVVEKKNAYFDSPGSNWELDSLMGKLDCGVKFLFRNEGEDVAVYMDSLDACSLANPSDARRTLDGLVTAFSFMHGCHALSWRDEIMFNDRYEPDELSPHFEKLMGDLRACKGSYEEGHLGLAMRMTECAANYFSRDDAVVAEIRKYLWQMNTAGKANEVNLYECLLLCSVIEGVTTLLLRSRAGWKDSDLKTKTAKERFEAIATHYKIPWQEQFELVVSAWKKPRNSLAHGDLFGATMENPDVLFGIGPMIGGGIFALMLADMGWQEPFDFKDLEKYGALYFAL